MSDTPRTEQRVVRMLSDLQSGTQEVVAADFARDLERELGRRKADPVTRLHNLCEALEEPPLCPAYSKEERDLFIGENDRLSRENTALKRLLRDAKLPILGGLPEGGHVTSPEFDRELLARIDAALLGRKVPSPVGEVAAHGTTQGVGCPETGARQDNAQPHRERGNFSPGTKRPADLICAIGRALDAAKAEGRESECHAKLHSEPDRG